MPYRTPAKVPQSSKLHGIPMIGQIIKTYKGLGTVLEIYRDNEKLMLRCDLHKTQEICWVAYKWQKPLTEPEDPL